MIKLLFGLTLLGWLFAGDAWELTNNGLAMLIAVSMLAMAADDFSRK